MIAAQSERPTCQSAKVVKTVLVTSLYTSTDRPTHSRRTCQTVCGVRTTGIVGSASGDGGKIVFTQFVLFFFCGAFSVRKTITEAKTGRALMVMDSRVPCWSLGGPGDTVETAMKLS